MGREVLWRGGGLALAVAAAACAGEASPPGVSARDSAGIRIVEHGPLPDRVALVVGEPIYRVGWAERDPQFERLVSGVLLSDGRAAVGDIGSSQVVMLDSAGGVEAVLGGPGEGPGEIGQLVSISRMPGDTLVVEDDGNARFTLFHGSERVRSHPMGGVNPYAC